MSRVAFGGYCTPRVLPAPARTTPSKARPRTIQEHGAVLASRPRPHFPCLLLFEGAGAGLLYFGARHEKNPYHPQFARMRAAWRAFRPTIVLLETRERQLIFGDIAANVRRNGEAGAAMRLAVSDGVDLASLEPERADVAAALLRNFSPPQVALAMTLPTYWGDLKGGAVSDADALRIPRKRTALAGVEGALPDLPHPSEVFARSVASTA